MAVGELLRTVRIGVESVRGTGVACTSIVDFESAELDHNVPVVRSANLTGGVFASPVVVPGVEVNRIKIRMASVNWDKVQRWLACGLDGSITASGAGATKTWATAKPPALSTGGAVTEALKSLTCEIGYANPSASVPAHKLTGCIVDRLKLIWAPGGMVGMEVDLVSASALTDITAFSGTLSPDASPVVPDFSGFACYIDDTTIGTTADTAVVGGELEWTSFMVLDDNRKRLAIGRQAVPKLTLTRFWEAADIIAAYRTKAKKKIRVQNTLTSGGVSYSLQADVYGLVTARPIQSVSGFVAEQIEVESRFDTTAATDVAFTVANSVTALT